MINFFRNLLKIRKKRRPLPSGPRPQVGSIIVRRSLRIRVSQPIHPDLWDWLMLSGWRVNTYKNDRRRYHTLPSGVLSQLAAVAPEHRSELHAQLVGRSA